MQFMPKLDPDKMPASLVLDHAEDIGDRWGGPYGGPPNMGGDFLPHIFTVAGRYGVATRSYSKGDEAWIASRMDCEIMRNEPAIMECLEARMRSVSLLNWHIEPIDEELDDRTKTILHGSRKRESGINSEELAAKMSLIMKYTPNITKMFYSLMDALWYGRYATYSQFAKTPIDGMGWATTIKKWEPRHGDKLVFRYNDNTGQNDPNQVGIRVGPGYDTQQEFTDYAGNVRRQVEATQYGLAYWLTSNQRNHIAVHRHIIEDGDFDHPIKADSIHGVGIRSRIYWTWKAYSECFKLLMEYIERTALGIEIWRYPAHNERAKSATEEAAQRRGSPGRSILMVPVPEGEQADLYSVDIVEPGLQGADVLQNVLHSFFGHKMKRYILGQTLSSEAESTGLGSGVANAHLATLADIVTWDARSLAETITTDILRPLQMWNFPNSQGVYLKFKFDTESPQAQQKLEAYRAAWEMGTKIKSEDIYQIIGASRPADGDDDVLDVNAGQGMGDPMGGLPPAPEAEPMTAVNEFGQPDTMQMSADSIAETDKYGQGDCDPNMKGPDGKSSCKLKRHDIEKFEAGDDECGAGGGPGGGRGDGGFKKDNTCATGDGSQASSKKKSSDKEVGSQSKTRLEKAYESKANKRLKDEVEYWMEMDREDPDEYGLEDALESVEDWALANKDSVLGNLRDVQIEAGIYREFTEEDDKNIIVSSGKKYDFKRGGKKWILADSEGDDDPNDLLEDDTPTESAGEESETKQAGMFGEDFEPGKFTDAEYEELTGESKKPVKVKEKQAKMFDAMDDDPDQGLMFQDEEPEADGKSGQWDDNEFQLASGRIDKAMDSMRRYMNDDPDEHSRDWQGFEQDEEFKNAVGKELESLADNYGLEINKGYDAQSTYWDVFTETDNDSYSFQVRASNHPAGRFNSKSEWSFELENDAKSIERGLRHIDQKMADLAAEANEELSEQEDNKSKGEAKAEPPAPPEASTGSRDGLEYFRTEAVSKAAEESREYKTRNILVGLSPDDFLKLAEPLPGGPDPRKEKVVKDVLEQGEKLSSIPNLVMDEEGNIIGHEGRHRAMALKNLGVEKIPVTLRSANIRWGEQQDSSSFDYQDKLPSEIIGEDGVSRVKSPFHTEGPDRGKVLPEHLVETSREVEKPADSPEGKKRNIKKMPLGDVDMDEFRDTVLKSLFRKKKDES